MKKMSHWGKPVALFALVLSAVGSLKAPATAVSSTTTANSMQKSESTSFQPPGNYQLAQTLVGQCRAPKERVFVYSQRSTTSQTIRTIGPNDQVTLADDGAAGWIAISSPTVGYVRVSELTACPAANRPNPAPSPAPSSALTQTTSLCRTVLYSGPEGGLAIRSGPDRSAPRVGGAQLGERVRLRTSPPPTTLDKDGRSWVEVTAPSRGWISYGYLNSKSINLGLCP